MRTIRLVPLLASLALFAPGIARAQIAYKMQPIVQLGGTAGGVPVPSGGGIVFSLGPLLDDGRLFWHVGSYVGAARADLTMLRQPDGKLEPVVAPNKEGGPNGLWPETISVARPLGFNQRGDLIMALGYTDGAPFGIGTYLRDGKTAKLSPLLLKGMPVVQNFKVFTVEAAGGYGPAINDRGEIVLLASVRNVTDNIVGDALLFLGQDGKLQPIMLPDQDLPGGEKPRLTTKTALEPSITETGAVAFLAPRYEEIQADAYLWEQGALTALVRVGSEAPGGARVASVGGVWLNRLNRAALIALAVESKSDSYGLYRLVDGKMTPVLVYGQEMPGGGRFQTLAPIVQLSGDRCTGVSPASTTGEHVFLAELQNGDTGVYRLDAADKLSLVLKMGMTTELGAITGLYLHYPAINSHGQVALAANIDHGPDTLLLLTPATP